MFKKLFSSKKEVATGSKVEKLNKNELNNVVGGAGSSAPAAPTPTPTPTAVVYEQFDYKGK